MPPVLDADIHLLEFRDGAVWLNPEGEPPPGLLARSAPRRCARGRERDFLFLALALSGRDSSRYRHAELASDIADAYFGTPGSVTAAMREAATTLNAELLKQNARGLSAGAPKVAGQTAGAPTQGTIAFAVLRNLDLYLGHCGPAFALVTHPATVERFGDPRARPLGASQSVDVLYYHTQVAAPDLLALCPAPPAEWETANFNVLAGTSLERARIRLTSRATASASLLLAHFAPPGTVPESDPAVEAIPPVQPSPAARAPRPLWPLGRRSSPPVTPPSPERESFPEPSPPLAEQPPPIKRSVAAPAPRPAAMFEEEEVEAESALDSEESAARQMGRSARAILRAVGVTLSEAFRSLRTLGARILPEGTLQRDGLFTLPPALLPTLAFAVPLVVVAVIIVAWFQRGRTEQFQLYLGEAQSEVAAARQQPDLLTARPHYEAALRALDRADTYLVTEDTLTLRAEAQNALDELDGVQRLNFQPAVPGGFGRTARLTGVLAGNRNLYALDAAANAVRLARPNETGFDYDTGFSCSPQAVATIGMGTLVDMAWLPGKNVLNNEAALIVLDKTGALLYCAPGVPPLANRLNEPEGGWANPVAMEVFAGRLYVLDAGANEIWEFDSVDGVFNQSPGRYFVDVAYDLSDVLDFAIAQGDVFLLHGDGRLTSCTRGGADESARCADLIFADGRLGRSDGPRIDGAVPSRINYDPPPEPSVYFLDTLAYGVYQYSLRLVFQRQFRSIRPFTAPVTAVAIGPNKELYLAAGDNIYFADR